MAKKVRSKDNTAIDSGALESEKRRLYVSRDNPERLNWVIAKLDEFYFGITPKENKTK